MSRYFFFFPIFLLLLVPSDLIAQQGILDFHGKVMDMIQFPPDEKSLITVCQKKIGFNHVSFLGQRDHRALIVQFSLQPETDIHKRIWLTHRYIARPFPNAGNQIISLPAVTAGEIIHWGYIFDRNGDGKIDYVAWLFGALPVKERDFPKDFPKADQTPLNKEVLSVGSLLLESGRLVFRHIADENFDGKVDAMVIAEFDPDIYSPGIWIDRWLLLRSTLYNGVLNDGWYFKDNIQHKLGQAYGYLGIYNYSSQRKRDDKFGPNELKEYSALLDLINTAAKECGFQVYSLHQRPVEKLVNGKTLNQWIQELHSFDITTRMNAAHTVGDIGRDAKKAVPHLLSLLKDSDLRVKHKAMLSLAKMGVAARDAIPILNQLAQSKDESIRNAAHFALAKVTPVWSFSSKSIRRTIDSGTYSIQVPDGQTWDVHQDWANDSLALNRQTPNLWMIRTVKLVTPPGISFESSKAAAKAMFDMEVDTMRRLGVETGRYTLSDLKTGEKIVGKRKFYFMSYVNSFPELRKDALVVLRATFLVFFPEEFSKNRVCYGFHFSETLKQDIDQPTMKDEFINSVLESFRITNPDPNLFQLPTYSMRMPADRDWQVLRRNSEMGKIELLSERPCPLRITAEYFTIKDSALNISDQEIADDFAKDVQKTYELPVVTESKGIKILEGRKYHTWNYLYTSSRKSDGETIAEKGGIYCYFPAIQRAQRIFFAFQISHYFRPEKEQPSISDSMIDSILKGFQLDIPLTNPTTESTAWIMQDLVSTLAKRQHCQIASSGFICKLAR